jgi:hypothetical protein
MEFINGVGPTSSNESRNENLENIIEVFNDEFGIWSMSTEDYEDEDRYLVNFGVGGPA